MGAQNGVFVDVESIVHRPRRMVRRDIEGFEIMVIIFDFRAIRDLETQLFKQCLDTHQRARNRMQSAGVLTAPGQCHIYGLFSETYGQLFGFQRSTARVQPFLHLLLGLVIT